VALYRVLSVTGLGADVREAATRAYAGMDQIHFADIQYRHDIAKQAL
jgi:phosphoribosylamine---glycine ligase